jgi:hypothetical protein
MEAICSSETSVDFQRTTRRYIPEDSTLHYSVPDPHKFNPTLSWDFCTINIIIIPHLFLDTPCNIFRPDFSTKVLHALLFSPMHDLEGTYIFYKYITQYFTYYIGADLLQIKSNVQKLNSRYRTT